MSGFISRRQRLNGSKQLPRAIGLALISVIAFAACGGESSAASTATPIPAGPTTPEAALEAVKTYLRTTEYEPGGSCLSAIEERQPEWKTRQLDDGGFAITASVQPRAFGRSTLTWTIFSIDGYVDPGQSPC